MKRKNYPRALSLLLVLTLMSSTVVSMTMAKYTTTGTVSDYARVAKWGVTLNVSGTLYGKQYDSITHTPVSKDANSISVKAEEEADGTRDKVVAPGTKNDKGLSFGINGTPETKVALMSIPMVSEMYLAEGNYAVMVEAKGLTEENFGDLQLELYKYNNTTEEYTIVSTVADSVPFDSNATYYQKTDYVENTKKYIPVTYTLTDNTTGNELTKGSAQEVNSYILDIITDVGPYREYPANTDLGVATGLSDVTITWEWPHEAKEDKAMKDGCDTILGNLFEGMTKPGVADGCVVKIGDDGVAKIPNRIYDGIVDRDYSTHERFNIDISAVQLD